MRILLADDDRTSRSLGWPGSLQSRRLDRLRRLASDRHHGDWQDLFADLRGEPNRYQRCRECGLRASAFDGATEIDGRDDFLIDNDGDLNRTLVFTATSTSTEIVFEDITIDGLGLDVRLDDVSLVKIQTPVDTDGDGVADYLDTDSDNDGFTDYVEAGQFITTPATYADPQRQRRRSANDLRDTLSVSDVDFRDGTYLDLTTTAPQAAG